LVIVIAYFCLNMVNATVRSAQRDDGTIVYVLLAVALIFGLTVPLLGVWATLTRRRWAPIVISAVALWVMWGAFVPPMTVLNAVIPLVAVGATIAAWLPTTRMWLATRAPSRGEGKQAS
jgi:hypothetical protein